MMGDQPPEVWERGDGSEVLKIALEIGPHVVAEPDRPLRGRLQIEGGRGKAALERERAIARFTARRSSGAR